jgi:hypothetical protein
LALAKVKSKLGQDLCVAAQIDRFLGDGDAEFQQDAADFLFFLQLQLAHGVVLLHNLERLNERAWRRWPIGRG